MQPKMCTKCKKNIAVEAAGKGRYLDAVLLYLAVYVE